MAAVCSTCTGTLYHTSPKSEAFEKRTQSRGQVYAGSEMAQPKRIRGKTQDVWWDYPKKDQETWQARTNIEKHWWVLDMC